MRIYEALNVLKDRLPIYPDSNKSYKKTLIEEFDAFNKIFQDIDNVDLKRVCSSDSSAGKVLTKKRMTNFTNGIQRTLLKIIDNYYEGYPGKAFDILSDLLGKNTFPSKREGLNKISAKNYINDIFGNYFRLKMKDEFSLFYRMRISENDLSKEELFHIPFDKRERVSTARFSIPGFPCLYLGMSLEVCWNEIGKILEPNEKVFACKYRSSKYLSFLNLTIPNSFREDDIVNDPFNIFRFLITYSFYSACLVKVQYPNLSFKPEYIIPQLLLQYVKNDDLLDGIIYSSTKDRNNSEKFHNVVIPTRKIADIGHCSMLKKWYSSSEVKEVGPSVFDDSIFDSCSFSKLT